MLQAFNFDIKYRKSAEHGNADGFSRLPIQETSAGNYDTIDIFQVENLETLPVTAKIIREETSNDKMLTNIRKALVEGKSLKPLGYNDGEFALQDNIIFKRERVVIPETLRTKVLRELHSGHFGTVRMKQLSRNFCWWANIDKDIEEITKNCEACTRFSNNPSKTKHHWEAASAPFERIHIDFAGPFMGHMFFVLVDAYTKWPEVHIVKDMSVQNTINKCREIFTTFGLPKTLVSDNGRTVISTEFKTFLKNNGIYHKCTAPYHPATNGLAERFVQTFKQALRKSNVTCNNIKTNLQKVLFQYRLTPHPELNKSPAEAMYGRKLKSRLDLMFPVVNKDENALENIVVLRNFREGERVAVREYLDKKTKWRFGYVIRKLGKLHYEVKLDNGKIWKRHVNQIKRIGNKINDKMRLCEVDHNGPIDNNDDSDSDSSRPRSKDLQTNESEEGQSAEANVPHQTVLPNTNVITNERPNADTEGRPQRNRRPSERYGNYLALF